jgi:iron complex outermembrane receptor protein
VVSAAGIPQTAEQTSKAFDIVDSAQIDLRAEYTVLDSLRLTPGLRIQQLGGPGSLARIQSRGLRAFDTSVLIDGIRLRDPSAPQGDATGIISDLLTVAPDRLEVLRGSGSSLHGTHATGGVVNIVTAQGGGAMHGDVSAEGGGLGFMRGLARLSGGAFADRFQYSAGLAHLNVTSGVDGDDRHRNTSGQGSAQWRLAPGTTVSGRIFGAGTFVGLNGAPFAAPNLPQTGFIRAVVLSRDQVRLAESGLPFAFGNATLAPAFNDPDSRRQGGFFSAMAALQHRFSDAASMRFAYNGLTTRRDNDNGPAGVRFQPLFSTFNLFDGRIDNVQARADLGVGRHQLISAGYEFERETYDNLSTDANPNPAGRVNARVQANETSHAVFAQDQIRMVGDRLQVSLSGRLQSFDPARPSFTGGLPPYGTASVPDPPRAYTGDASLAYFIPSSGTKLRAHAGNAYRAPSLYERYGTSFFLGAFSPLGDPRLRPERSIGIDVGVDQYFAASRFRLSATYFYTRLQEVIEFDFSGAIDRRTDPFARSSGYRNTGGGLARGVEMSAEATPLRSTRLQAAYTYTNSDDRNSIFIGGGVRSIRIFDHSFTALVSQSIGRHVDITMDFEAGSNYLAPLFVVSGSRGFIFDGPRKADVVFSYTRPVTDGSSLRFYTRIENIFDRVYFEEGFPTPGAWAVAGIKFLF